MTTTPPQPTQHERSFNARQTFMALAIAALIAAFGGAVIYAASNAGSHTGPWMHGWGPDGWGGHAPAAVAGVAQ